MARQSRSVQQQEEGILSIAEMFRNHLEEHHHVKTEAVFPAEQVRQHLSGESALLPVTIFSNKNLSALEAIVKHLRENEGLHNSEIAKILKRSPATTWITYRNAGQKMPAKIAITNSDVFIPTEAFSDERLSILEGISAYLHGLGHTYRRIGQMLNRDERTIWTVCARARRKIAS